MFTGFFNLVTRAVFKEKSQLEDIFVQEGPEAELRSLEAKTESLEVGACRSLGN